MLKLKEVSLIYGRKEVFSGISLEIKKGDKIVISGSSGCGKTSLFGLILGFVFPAEGRILFENEVVNPQNIWALRRKIAYVDQDASLGAGRVEDWFGFIFSLQANRKLGIKQEDLIPLFDYFELDKEILEERIENLSGGQRQRLALITAAILKREFFLLDEPTSFLDNRLKKKTAEFFMKLPQTLIVASHDSTWQNYLEKVFSMEKRKWL